MFGVPLLPDQHSEIQGFFSIPINYEVDQEAWLAILCNSTTFLFKWIAIGKVPIILFFISTK